MPRGTRARGAHGGGISRDCAGSSLEWEHGDPGKVPPLVLRVGTGSLSLGTLPSSAWQTCSQRVLCPC